MLCARSRILCRVILRRSSSCATSRLFSSVVKADEQILGPEIPGSASPKTYPPKIETIANEISQLTLLEISELCELLQHKLNIKTPGPMMHAMPMMQPAHNQSDSPAADQPAPAKSSFSVRLLKFDPTKKVPLIKEIKAVIPEMNLVQAKKFVESSPGTVKTDLGKDEAEELKKVLEAVGATVEID